MYKVFYIYNMNFYNLMQLLNINYYQNNSPDAFGNAPYARLEGFLGGYISGAKMELERGKDLWIVRKGKRKILAVEVPKKPQSYYDDMKDNAKTIRSVFG